MKSFTKKSFLQKIIITILVALLLSNFIVPTISNAEDKDEEDLGGVLFSPIQHLTLGIGDTLLLLANSCAYGEWVDPIMTLSESWNAFSISKVALSILARTSRNCNCNDFNNIRVMGI